MQNYPMQSHGSEMELRERVKGVEMAVQYNHGRMDDQGKTLHRIGNKVIDNEKWTSEIQDRVSTMEPEVKEFAEIRRMVLSLKRAWVIFRGVANTVGTAIIVYLLLRGDISAENMRDLIKVAGL
jgi:2-phosphoglycerate kinase